jgi:TraM recognition site of TraD and TraG/Type IV secretion-system coupling protein DNA-binding domain
MENYSLNNAPKFKSAEEELTFLRAHLAEKEANLKLAGQEANKERVATGLINEYKKLEPAEVMHKSAVMNAEHAEALVLRLRPEAHDSKMEEMLGVLLDKGVSTALSLIAKMDNPHLDDDFHRFLVQYLYSTHQVPGLKERTPLFKALDMKLFEITLPDPNDKDADKKGLKELLSAMEQFYAGMHSVGEGRQNKDRSHFTVEIALAEGTDNFVFYTAVPTHKADLFEKQLLGVHANAKVVEMPDDYNIFTEGGHVAASYAKLVHNEVYPIKLYDALDHDPLNIILNVFTKLKRSGEGASIQFTICPEDDSIIEKYHTILSNVKSGMTVKVASSITRQFAKEFGSVAKSMIFGVPKHAEEKKVNEKAVESITEKMKSTIMATNIRIVTSAESELRASVILSDIESSFNQFTESDRNGFDFHHPEGRELHQLVHEFSYRTFSEEYAIPLNLKELATVFHFPHGINNSPQLKQAKAGIAPAPMEMGSEGIVLGVNSYRGIDTSVHMSREDRMRHFYVIGQTGTGKTNILLNMITQDIQNGDGVCYIDPHGTDIQTILSRIPRERIDDVIYFDPAYTARPMGLNMLEYDPKYPEQKTFVVNELMGIFNKLFTKESMGPMFEQYFKNSAFLIMDDPNTKGTLLEITRVLGNKEFRDDLVSRCKNPIIREFWKSAEQTTGDQSIANFVPYISSKFDNFISNDIMRPVVLQQKSSFNFREIMDNKKILLVNLSKGRLGDINANLIGLLLVGKIQMAALSRVDMFGKPMNDFYLYIDEFQNVTTDSIASILSEARKYRLSLNVAHQYISQLEDNIKNAIFGNVGSMAVFRVGTEDAEFLEGKFKPVFTASDIIKLDNFNAYVSMLVKGQPTKPFNIKTLAPVEGNLELVDKIKELSYLTYGRPREEIEEEIMERYNQI